LQECELRSDFAVSPVSSIYAVSQQSTMSLSCYNFELILIFLAEMLRRKYASNSAALYFPTSPH